MIRCTRYRLESARLTADTSVTAVAPVRAGTPGSVGVGAPHERQNFASSGRLVLQAAQIRVDVDKRRPEDRRIYACERPNWR